jgi:membrane associated rhomboid family serine protease
VLFVIFLVGAGALAYRASTAEDRARLLRTAIAIALELKAVATRRDPVRERFGETLRARTPYAGVTIALVALNVAIFVRMLFGAGALGDADTLVAWGGNVGLRTTNGEWWRLVTSLFVETGFFHLVIDAAALLQVGLLLERLVGSRVFGSVYLAAGIVAAIVSVRTSPVSVSAGGAGAMFGLYGLLLAATLWTLRGRPADDETDEESIEPDQSDEPTISIPLKSLTRLVPITVLFVLSNLAGGTIPVGAELAAFAVGAVAGAIMTADVSQRKASGRRLGQTMAGAAIVAIALAVPVRGIADVRPEIRRVVALEDRTTTAYAAALDRFKRGRMTAEALAQTIERTIVPELEAADSGLKAIRRVPIEHQPLVADADEYLRLRAESWRLRAQGLRTGGRTPAAKATGTGGDPSEASWRLRAEAQHRATLVASGKAEAAERESLAAFEKIKQAQP